MVEDPSVWVADIASGGGWYSGLDWSAMSTGFYQRFPLFGLPLSFFFGYMYHSIVQHQAVVIAALNLFASAISNICSQAFHVAQQQWLVIQEAGTLLWSVYGWTLLMPILWFVLLSIGLWAIRRERHNVALAADLEPDPVPPKLSRLEKRHRAKMERRFGKLLKKSLPNSFRKHGFHRKYPLKH